MKKVVFVLAVAFLAGCASQEHVLTSSDPDRLRISDEQPEGYPKVSIIHQGPVCARLHESWRESEYQGQTIWLKQESLTTVTCPGS